MDYTGAGGENIRNLGEGKICGESEEGIPVGFQAQVGDKMKKLLLAARKISEAENMVFFNADRESLEKLLKEGKVEKDGKVGKEVETEKVVDGEEERHHGLVET